MELRKIEKIIQDNREILLEVWYEYFGGERCLV